MKINPTTVTIVVISLVALIGYYVSVVNQKTKSIYAAVESHSQRDTVNTSSAVNVPIESEATRPQKAVPRYTPTTIPDSIIDERLKQLRDSGQHVVNQMWQSGAPETRRREQIAEYQVQYDAAKQQLLTAKQQLAAIRQLHSQGTLDDIATERAMWRIVGLPQDTVEDISLPKPLPVPVSPSTHGVVTGLLLSETTPMAVIDGKVISLGQSIYGVKVVKIQDVYVEFDKSGVRWRQTVAEPASANWP